MLSMQKQKYAKQKHAPFGLEILGTFHLRCGFDAVCSAGCALSAGPLRCFRNIFRDFLRTVGFIIEDIIRLMTSRCGLVRLKLFKLSNRIFRAKTKAINSNKVIVSARECAHCELISGKYAIIHGSRTAACDLINMTVARVSS